MKVSILIAEDDPLLRTLLSEILAREEAFQVVGKVGNGQDVATATEELQPDVVLLDLHLPGVSSSELLDRLTGLPNVPRLLILSGDETLGTQMDVARYGARGFLAKSQGISQLPEAIRAVAAGRVWFRQEVVDRVFSEYPVLLRQSREQERPIHRLSEKEREVLIRVAKGMTNPQIASELFVSVSTVKAHLQSIFRKLEIPSRTELILFAVREGLLEP